MDEKDYELLLDLNRTKNITKTAQELYMTQPAITKRIQKMEEELQCTLFLRSKKGILFKGGVSLESLAEVKAVVMDKTGTITKGQFGVTQIITNGVSKEALLEVAAIIESGSNHPIAKSVVNAYSGELPKVNFEEFKEISGAGLLAKVDGKTLLAGNDKLMKQFKQQNSIVSKEC